MANSNRKPDSYDRSSEDVGNILQLEHVNLTVPDQGIAALFYVTGLGFTRDPYIDFGTFNMWINLGEQQFHLPKAGAQRLRGHIGVVVPNLDDRDPKQCSRDISNRRERLSRAERQSRLS